METPIPFPRNETKASLKRSGGNLNTSAGSSCRKTVLRQFPSIENNSGNNLPKRAVDSSEPLHREIIDLTYRRKRWRGKRVAGPLTCNARGFALAALVSAVISGGLTAFASPDAAGFAHIGPASLTDPMNATAKSRKSGHSLAIGAIPLGCDPAFSSIANPAQALIFGRCMV
jgi:hypothetical protein